MLDPQKTDEKRIFSEARIAEDEEGKKLKWLKLRWPGPVAPSCQVIDPLRVPSHDK